MLDSAYSLNDRVFFNNLGTILLYAVVGTLMNFFMIGEFWRTRLSCLLSCPTEASFDQLQCKCHGTLFDPTARVLTCWAGPALYGLSAAGAMGSFELSLVQALVFASFIVAVDPVAVRRCSKRVASKVTISLRSVVSRFSVASSSVPSISCQRCWPYFKKLGSTTCCTSWCLENLS